MKPIFLENILPPDHCYEIERAFLDHIENGYKNEEEELKNNTGNVGIYAPYKQIPKLNHFLKDRDTPKSFFNILTDTIKKYYKEPIQYKNSYLRVYYNNCSLPIHIDRKNLDITLSVNVGGVQDWPIHISNIKKTNGETFEDEMVYRSDYETYLIPKGCGVVCYGNYPHWRDKLNCKENEYMMQIFYHWTFI